MAAKRSRAGVPVQLFMDPELRAAVGAYLDAFLAETGQKATITTTIELALKQFLTGKGHWPPPKKSPKPPRS